MAIESLNGLPPAQAAPRALATPAIKTPTQSSGASIPVDHTPALPFPVAQDASTLRQNSAALAKALSAAQTASHTFQKQADLTAQLRQLALHATLGGGDHQELDLQFQQIVSQLNELGGVPSLTTRTLPESIVLTPLVSQTRSAAQPFISNPLPTVSSVAEAQQALPILATASDTLTQAQSEISNYTQTLHYAAASVESALFNHAAAASTLTEADLASQAANVRLTGLIQNNAGAAVQTQSALISPAVLDLVN